MKMNPVLNLNLAPLCLKSGILNQSACFAFSQKLALGFTISRISFLIQSRLNQLTFRNIFDAFIPEEVSQKMSAGKNHFISRLTNANRQIKLVEAIQGYIEIAINTYLPVVPCIHIRNSMGPSNHEKHENPEL
jgi:hypothetical protein